MDDNIKIQALMIYYKHWGNEQNHQRKIIHGFLELKQHIFKYTHESLDVARQNFDMMDDDEEVAAFEEHLDKLKNNPSSLYECLQKCFDDEPLFEGEHQNELSLGNISFFSELLLEGCAHLDFLEKELPTEEDLLDQKKNSLDYFCEMSEEAIDILYGDDFTEQHVLSVEAIVALM